MMYGPNVFDTFPGVQLKLDWPELASAQVDAMLECALEALRRCRSTGAAFQNIASGRAVTTSDDLVAGIAHALLDRMTPHADAPSGYRPGCSVHHSDVHLAAFTARAAVIAANMALEAGLSSEIIASTSERIDRMIDDMRKRWTPIAIGESGWRKIQAAQQRNIPWTFRAPIWKQAA